jgi:hypothetical protein
MMTKTRAFLAYTFSALVLFGVLIYGFVTTELGLILATKAGHQWVPGLQLRGAQGTLFHATFTKVIAKLPYGTLVGKDIKVKLTPAWSSSVLPFVHIKLLKSDQLKLYHTNRVIGVVKHFSLQQTKKVSFLVRGYFISKRFRRTFSLTAKQNFKSRRKGLVLSGGFGKGSVKATIAYHKQNIQVHFSGKRLFGGSIKGDLNYLNHKKVWQVLANVSQQDLFYLDAHLATKLNYTLQGSLDAQSAALNVKKLSGNWRGAPIHGHVFWQHHVAHHPKIEVKLRVGKHTQINWRQNTSIPKAAVTILDLHALYPGLAGSLALTTDAVIIQGEPRLRMRVHLKHFQYDANYFDSIKVNYEPHSKDKTDIDATIKDSMYAGMHFAFVHYVATKKAQNIKAKITGLTSHRHPFFINWQGQLSTSFFKGMVTQINFNRGEVLLSKPSEVSYQNQQWHISPICLRGGGKGHRLCFGLGQVDAATIHVVLQAKQWPMRLLSPLFKHYGYIGASGLVQGDLRAVVTKGLIKSLQGDLSIQKSSFQLKDLGMAIVLNHLKLHAIGDSATLEGVLFERKHKLVLQGHLQLQPKLQGEINLKADRVHLFQQGLNTIIASPNLTVKYKSHVALLSGQLQINEGFYQYNKPKYQTTDLENDIVFVKVTNPLQEQRLVHYQGKVMIKVDPGFKVNLEGLQGGVKGEINLLIDDQEPTMAQGRLNLLAGEYLFRGQKLEVSHASLMYLGGEINNPYVDLQAERVIHNVNQVGLESSKLTVGVTLRGNLDKYKLDFFSRPMMLSNKEVLAYLLTGYAPKFMERGGGNVNLSGSLRGDVLNMLNLMAPLQKALNLDELSFQQANSGDPALENGNGLSDTGTHATSIAFGKRLTDKLYLKLVRTFSSEGSLYSFYLNYHFSPYFEMRGFTNAEGQSINFVYSQER